MLNYWRTTGGGDGGGAATFFTGNSTSTANIPLIPAFSDYGFDGPFFDLEFTLSNHINPNHDATENSQTSDEDMREIELNDQNLNPHSSIVSNGPEENSKFPVPVLKSAAKLGVLFKKSGEIDEAKGPLISLFARDYSISATNSEHLGKEMLQKYLNILKPLYVRVEKMKFHGGATSPPAEMGKAGLRSNNLQAGFKVVRKHLGKSRSTSSPPGKMGSNRRDDSLLEVQDGIQGAILHCKRSFNSNRERELSRSVSDAYCEKSVISSCASYSGKVVETGV